MRTESTLKRLSKNWSSPEFLIWASTPCAEELVNVAMRKPSSFSRRSPGSTSACGGSEVITESVFFASSWLRVASALRAIIRKTAA